MKLELKHLAGYLPYGLGIYSETYGIKSIMTISGNGGDNPSDSIESVLSGKFKPLLRPVSSLDTQELINDLHGNLPDNVFDWIDSFNLNSVDKNEAILCAPFPVIQWCYKNHIDIYGLIDKGLAIAIED
jgi:hypothetical protein